MLLIIAVLLISPVIPQALFSFPALKPDPPAAAYAEKLQAPHDWRVLAEIALWASGAGETPGAPASTAAYMAKIESALVDMLGSPELPADARERGAYTLAFMHRRFLKGYREDQTRLDTLLDSGVYNCVSSAALYAILASAAGLEARGTAARDHAFVMLRAETEFIDVETTNPYGFDPGNRREFHDAFGKLTGFVYVPARNYQDRISISPGELISLIFNNRITLAESRSRFDEALSLALNKAALLQSTGPQKASPITGTAYAELFQDPWKMLLDRLINYGAYLINTGREPEALEWAALAEQEYPEPARWRNLTGTALNNLVLKMVRAGNPLEAAAVLARHKMRIGADDFKRLDSLLADARLGGLFSGIKTIEDADTALAALRETGSNLPAGRAAELGLFGTLKKAELVAHEQGWRAAIDFLEGQGERRGERRLEEQLRVFRANRTAELHNAFAAAYNRRDYTQAQRIITEALEEFPGSPQLLRDRELAEQAGQRAVP
jgi:tetratricopeptide (TPR) repeat protein